MQTGIICFHVIKHTETFNIDQNNTQFSLSHELPLKNGNRIDYRGKKLTLIEK